MKRRKKSSFIVFSFLMLLLFGTNHMNDAPPTFQSTIVEASTTQLGVTTGSLNLRKGAGTNFGVIKVLPKGAQVTIFNRAGVWLNVKTGTQQGYVHSAYIKETPRTGSTSASSLNFRKGAGMRFGVIRKLPKGTRLTMISQTGNWMKVKVGSQEGYVHGSYVLIDSVQNSSPAINQAGMTTATVNFRHGAGTSYASIKRLPKGQRLTILSESGKWLNVKVGTKVGWVSSTYVKPVTSKVVYLTFDDGPSKNTSKVLDILKQNKIKGTFFVQGASIKNNKNSDDLLNRMVKEGHYIGLHSMTHEKSILYQGRQAATNFLNEMLELQQIVKQKTGFESKLYRPPYGTYRNFTQSHITTMKNSVFRGWDWNVDSNDWSAKTTMQVMDNIKFGLNLRRESESFVVLFHEHDITVASLQIVIDYFKSLGYEFEVYTPKDHFQMNLIQEPDL